MSYSTIVIFCNTLPGWTAVTDAQQIGAEFLFLRQKFGRVIVVPTSVDDLAEFSGIQNNVEIESLWVSGKDFRRYYFRPRHLFSSEMWRLTSGDRSLNSINFASEMMSFAAAIRRWIDSQKLNLETTLFYAFRFDLAAGALGLLSKSMSIKFLSRAHFEDLCCSFMPKRVAELVAASAKALFASDLDSADTLRKQFPMHAEKIGVELLGSSKSQKESLALHHIVTDRKLTFLSVACLIDEKRVDLNYKMLKALAIARPQTDIRWIHVGDGPLMQSLCKIVEKDKPVNLIVELTGSKDDAFVHALYQSEQIDWFMLLSEGEGMTYSVCKSLSYGVPVVGTMVRGLRDAIDDDCGLLLAADPEPEEFVRGILPYVESDYRMDLLRENAFNRWTEHFDSDKLRPQFVERISSL